MKHISAVLFLSLLVSACHSQKSNSSKIKTNALLWRISGNGLTKPSYLFGTIHMLCEDDAVLSDSLKIAISRCDDVYLEVQMDNLFEMIGAMGQMKMNGDTTLSDLLSKEDYEKVKNYFEQKQSMIPFSMLETFKPILAASTLEESSLPCGTPVAMEQLIMQEAKSHEKDIKGLETMAYQAGILDSIPYTLQAKQLVNYIDSVQKGVDETKEFNQLLDAYKKEDLNKLEELTKESDIGMSRYTDILLYNRNRNWVKKLKTLLPGKSLVIAVGAGHLPGDQGVINLLRKAGYTVNPIPNKKAGLKVI
ncbi:MAG: TraB/GumN family protein [Bacteroidetes bacterium]|nr:TraB/GumN family protein [Bacteroidota bacterium]MBS1931776.1 TraB/GumN family protein [Bacteroidota bacterium]